MFLRRFFPCVIGLVAFGWLGLGCSNQNAPAPVSNQNSPAPVVAPPVDNHDESIVPSSTRAPNDKVQNGDVYDQAILKAVDIKTLMVPDNARLERSGADGAIELYVKKSLSFGGHPPEPITLEGARKKMGCATKVENGKVTLATYGEFSTKEGGSDMKLLLRVPAKLSVETQPGLSGPKSEGQRKQDGGFLTKEPDAKDGYWYGPASAGPGWKTIPMQPDPKRTAK